MIEKKISKIANEHYYRITIHFKNTIIQNTDNSFKVNFYSMNITSKKPNVNYNTTLQLKIIYIEKTIHFLHTTKFFLDLITKLKRKFY